MMSPMVSDRVQVATVRVITFDSGSSSTPGATLRQRAHDVAFRHDADHAMIGAEHQQRTDSLLGEPMHCRHQCGGRRDGHDITTLGLKNGLDVHWVAPSTGIRIIEDGVPAIATTVLGSTEFRQVDPRDAVKNEPENLCAAYKPQRRLGPRRTRRH